MQKMSQGNILHCGCKGVHSLPEWTSRTFGHVVEVHRLRRWSIRRRGQSPVLSVFARPHIRSEEREVYAVSQGPLLSPIVNQPAHVLCEMSQSQRVYMWKDGTDWDWVMQTMCQCVR